MSRSTRLPICLFALLALSACGPSQADAPITLGRDPPPSEATKQPVQMPVNAPAVARSTDAGAADEGGPIEAK